MRGMESQGLGILIIVVSFLLVVGLILLVLGSQNTGLRALLGLSCDVCNMAVGNFVSGITFHIINPCVMLFNCCDPNAPQFGGSCGFGGGSASGK
jgi:hypothetical protein